MSLTDAAQAVQYSAYPDAYAKWEPQATTLVQALSGGPLQLNCAAGARMPTAGSPTGRHRRAPTRATPELTATLAAAQAELGGLTVVGISDGRPDRDRRRSPCPNSTLQRPAARWPPGPSRTASGCR